MRKVGYTIAVVFAVACFCSLAVPQSRISGKVVGVSDGDTITVLTPQKKQIKVRLAGIDAPETGQDYGDAAKRYLSDLVFGETVTLEGGKMDRYGRLVAKVLKGGSDVNVRMVHNGLAWHYKKYESEQPEADRAVYAWAEASARQDRLNLWTYSDPTPPWDFRGNGQRAASVPAPRVPRATTPRAVPMVVNQGAIIGNRRSMIYHAPRCPSYDKVAEHNRVYFRTAQEAERAGYRAARNC